MQDSGTVDGATVMSMCTVQANLVCHCGKRFTPVFLWWYDTNGYRKKSGLHADIDNLTFMCPKCGDVKDIRKFVAKALSND